MFLVYVNNLVRSSQILKFKLYADDTSVCLSGANLSNLIENLNRELYKVKISFCANRLCLNSIKSQFIIFHSRQCLILVNVLI